MGDKFLTRDQQLAFDIQSAQGTGETLTAADVLLKPFRADTPFAPDYLRFANDEVAEDIAQAADFVAGLKATIAIGCLLKTSGVVGTAPAIGKLLRGCAMKEQAVKTISVGVQSGGDSAFAAGETYTATGSKTGIIEYALAGAGTLRYIVTTGGDLASSDVIVANGDSATASSASAEYATKYTPRSTGQEILTIWRGEKNDAGTSAQDSIFKLRDAMGKFSIAWEPMNVGMFNGEFMGVVESVAAGSFLSGYTYESTTPPTFKNATIQINGVSIQPGNVSFDSGNSVEMEPDPSTTGGASGYDQARVAVREPTITLGPFKQIHGTLDLHALHTSGATVAFAMTMGASANMIKLIAPAVQVRAWGLGERSGRRTEDITLHVCRSTLTDEDYAIYFM